MTLEERIDGPPCCSVISGPSFDRVPCIDYEVARAVLDLPALAYNSSPAIHLSPYYSTHDIIRPSGGLLCPAGVL